MPVQKHDLRIELFAVGKEEVLQRTKREIYLSDVIIDGFTSTRKTELKTSSSYGSERLLTSKVVILYTHFICFLTRAALIERCVTTNFLILL